MIDKFPEVKPAFDALAVGRIDAFVRLFFDAENETCEWGDKPRCAENFLDAWLINGFRFYITVIDRLRALDEFAKEGDVAMFESGRCYLANYVYAFRRYCERLDLSFDQALAMWPSHLRLVLKGKIDQVPSPTIGDQVHALIMANNHFVDSFGMISRMYGWPEDNLERHGDEGE
jgi:hypothetical protein